MKMSLPCFHLEPHTFLIHLYILPQQSNLCSVHGDLISQEWHATIQCCPTGNKLLHHIHIDTCCENTDRTLHALHHCFGFTPTHARFDSKTGILCLLFLPNELPTSYPRWAAAAVHSCCLPKDSECIARHLHLSA